MAEEWYPAGLRRRIFKDGALEMSGPFRQFVRSILNRKLGNADGIVEFDGPVRALSFIVNSGGGDITPQWATGGSSATLTLPGAGRWRIGAIYRLRGTQAYSGYPAGTFQMTIGGVAQGPKATMTWPNKGTNTGYLYVNERLSYLYTAATAGISVVAARAGGTSLGGEAKTESAWAWAVYEG